jgi:NAD(P)-dependent dehydrogenase (short-subunit alcohol dehydrogenase family)
MAPRADAPGPAGPDGLAGRVALVTGGSGGIGRVLSRRLAAAGAAVAVGYGQHAQAATDTAAQIIAAGGRATAVGADLGDPAALATWSRPQRTPSARWTCWSATQG